MTRDPRVHQEERETMANVVDVGTQGITDPRELWESLVIEVHLERMVSWGNKGHKERRDRGETLELRFVEVSR